ncbi:MAG: glycoside hydrolase family 2 TIM barrel-domain containing protein [Mariniblastus sp.]
MEVKKSEDGTWQLLRAGQPYFIRGVGGEERLKMLAEYGGNSIRTWGVKPESRKILDDAQANGLTVAFGLWLEHERHGALNYENFEQVKKQMKKTLDDVRAYKDHPAILVWGLGNEMEIPETGDNPAVWLHVEHLAREIKKIDPNHPVMTVIAEMGGNKIEAIHRFCPSVDIIGINSYGGCGSLPARYRAATEKLAKDGMVPKPFVVTEYGPIGTWELPKNSIDTVEEEPSTLKAKRYEAAYLAMKDEKKLNLGSYAFLWGNKQETTATWFGMLLADGKKTAAVDTMSNLWTGKPPANLCPTIASLKLEGSQSVESGAILKLALDARDPEGKPINVRWSIVSNSEAYGSGGDFEEASKALEGNLISSDKTKATFKAPTESGLYRIYAYADDGYGAAVANVPIRVKGDQMPAGQKATLPFVVFDEPGEQAIFIPSGFMGSADAIKVDSVNTTDPAKGKHCMKVTYSKDDEWGGVVWQSPENDWGDKEGGLNLTGAKRLRFKVRGESGGEKIKFGVGVIGREKDYFDTTKKEIEFTLTSEWQECEIKLEGEDLTRIKTAFFWSAAAEGKPFTFYLDEIVFE